VSDPRDSSAPPVFAWITGELTNVGDSLLRRPYVQALAGIGPLDLWINRSNEDFLSGVAVPPDARVTAGFRPWYLRLLRTALRRRTILVLNAGEFRVHASRTGLLVALLIAAKIVKLRGGATMWIGVSVPLSERRIQRLAVRHAARTIDYLQWRDPESNLAAGVREVGPDWGFDAGTTVGRWPELDARPMCAIVLRGDRPAPTREWNEWVVATCARLGLQPVVIVQVRQDIVRADEAARALDAELVPWPDDVDHRTQEETIREVYRRSRIVIGDRLHGLIIGVTEGAVPIGWVESSRGKIARHFATIGMSEVGEYEGRPGGALPVLTAERIEEIGQRARDAVTTARADLQKLAGEIGGLRNSQEQVSLRRLRRAQPRADARVRARRNAAE
jgi:hypothetical protein